MFKVWILLDFEWSNEYIDFTTMCVFIYLFFSFQPSPFGAVKRFRVLELSTYIIIFYIFIHKNVIICVKNN